jgi:hypothetical protein
VRIVLEKQLQFISFWSINSALELSGLREQLDELQAAGLDGVVFHPRNYPNEPAYMSQAYLDIVSELILYAKSKGMVFWIYDENGWPSGTGGGEVLRRLPHSRCHWIQWVPDSLGGGSIEYGSHTGISSFDESATAAFIAFTHEGYRRGLLPEAFDYVEGFFADEVAFLDGHGLTLKTGALPWDERLPLLYQSKYGEELAPLLPLLFRDEERAERVRIRYWELLTDLLIHGFYRPVQAWCAMHGKRFTAHLKAEEHPYFQLSYSGSCFQVLKGVETPAVDALEREPGNHFYPRIAHSIAMQQGRKHCLVEAMGGSGWGVSPASFTKYMLWLAGHGMDQFVLHLNQFRLTTQAIQDWPPSMPSHMTWKDAFSAVLTSVREQAASLPDLRLEPDVLIVTPTRGIMAGFDPKEAMQMNEHDGSNVPASAAGEINRRFLSLIDDCFQAGIHYELTEERVLEEMAIVTEGSLRIGVREYKQVVISEGCFWHQVGMVARLEAAGIPVWSTEQWQAMLPTRELSEQRVQTRRIEPIQSEWDCLPPKSNQLLLDFQRQTDGRLTAELPVEDPHRIRGIDIFVHDEVERIAVNGEELVLTAEGDGFRAAIPDTRIRETLTIEMTPVSGGQPVPMVYLRGSFVVASLSPFEKKDERQWQTEGPFVLKPCPDRVDGGDLILGGFPFCGQPVHARKTIQLDSVFDPGGRLVITNASGDAARVWVDEQELGWCWGPDWSVPLTAGLGAGTHVVTLQLYSSTYNVYGPHRHIDGDRCLISPDQYRGVKNFADRPDAPEETLGDRWHFVTWHIDGKVELHS